MKPMRMKNLVLAMLLACFFHGGQKICLEPQGGGVDTGNPKGEPTNDPTKPATMEQRLEEIQRQFPGLMGGGSETVGPQTEGGTQTLAGGTEHIGPQTDGGVDTLARGGHELGPKIIKA